MNWSRHMRIKVFLSAVIILATSSYCFASGSPAVKKQKTQDPGQQMADFSLSGFCDKGRKNWDISGKSADIGGESIKLNDIVGNLYGERENVKLTAAKGDVNRQDSKVHLQDNVVVTTSSGARMTTDSLDWDRKGQLVSTSDQVNINKEDIIIVAQGAKGYPDMNKVDLEKDVQVQINNPAQPGDAPKAGKEATIITCDGPLQVDYLKNIAVFSNNVKVVTKDAVIESDIMEVYFLSGGKPKTEKPSIDTVSAGAQIEKIIARGNVKINHNQNISYSDEAVYDAKDRKITLSGKPRLVIYSTEGLNASFGD
jgi:LPS export ABC transporter protein LptC